MWELNPIFNLAGVAMPRYTMSRRRQRKIEWRASFSAKPVNICTWYVYVHCPLTLPECWRVGQPLAAELAALSEGSWKREEVAAQL